MSSQSVAPPRTRGARSAPPSAVAPLTVPDGTLSRLSDVFKMLADKSRLQIVLALARDGELHVTDLCQLLRGPVHSSVAKPYSVGLPASQRPTTFSWAAVSLGGRPDGGRAASAAGPRSRKAATQRRTLRGSTPRKSATSSQE